MSRKPLLTPRVNEYGTVSDFIFEWAPEPHQIIWIDTGVLTVKITRHPDGVAAEIISLHEAETFYGDDHAEMEVLAGCAALYAEAIL